MISKSIKKTLIDQDINMTQLAKMTGYSRTHLSAIVNGRFHSPRAEKIVAMTLGITLNDHNSEKPKA